MKTLSPLQLPLGFRAAIPLLLVLTAACSSDPIALAQKHLAQGAALMQKGEYAKAVIEFRNAVRATPRDGKARLQLAEAHLKTGDTRNAIQEFARAADLLPDDVQAQLRAGDVMLVTGNYDRAREISDALLKKDRGIL